MGATSTPARVSSVASIGNVCISISCNPVASLYKCDHPECKFDPLVLKVPHAGANTEISLA
jgi:hypothetical protein